MKEILIMLAIVAVWFILQAYILPRMGISTWLNQSCQVADKKSNAGKLDGKDVRWNFAKGRVIILCLTIIQKWRWKAEQLRRWLRFSAMDNMAIKTVYVPSAGNFWTTLCNALKNTPFRRTNQSAPNVLYTATNRIWGRKSGQWWNMPVPACFTGILSCQVRIIWRGNNLCAACGNH